MKPTIQEEWPEVTTFCWGCGKNNNHGLQLKSYWDDEEVVASFTPKDYHLAFPGILNGGIISTLIDCHGTGTANAYGHKMKGTKNGEHFMYVTGSLFVKFIRPTPLKKPVSLRAKVKEIKDNKIIVECTLHSGNVLCATGEVMTVRVGINSFMSQ